METVATEPLRPRTFRQYRDDLVNMSPPGVKPLYTDLRVPACQQAYDSQLGSTWRTIPANSPSSWNGWTQVPDGIEYSPAIWACEQPPAYSRHSWNDFPVAGRFRDARLLIPAAIGNGIALHSTFASTEHVSAREQSRILLGYRRCIRATIGISL